MASTAKPRLGPRACFTRRPTFRTIRFCGRYISLREISWKAGLAQGHASKVFTGQRRLTLNLAEKISTALDMPLEDFIVALREHLTSRKRPATR